MLIIWEVFSRIVVWFTKIMFKTIVSLILIIAVIKYTPVGEGIQAVSNQYAQMTGKQINVGEILDDLDAQVEESMSNLGEVQKMFNKKPN